MSIAHSDVIRELSLRQILHPDLPFVIAAAQESGEYPKDPFWSLGALDQLGNIINDYLRRHPDEPWAEAVPELSQVPALPYIIRMVQKDDLQRRELPHPPHSESRSPDMEEFWMAFEDPWALEELQKAAAADQGDESRERSRSRTPPRQWDAETPEAEETIANNMMNSNRPSSSQVSHDAEHTASLTFITYLHEC